LAFKQPAFGGACALSRGRAHNALTENLPPNPAQVALMILDYINENPNAKDTAEGIAQWWVHQPRELVERALELLTGLSFVIARTVRGTGEVYELAAGREEEIRQWRKGLE
jgi:hypothetical protein